MLLLVLALSLQLESNAGSADFRKQIEAALPGFSKACSAASDGEGCYFLGRALYALDRWPEAVEPFNKALRSAPRPKLARIHRAAALNYIALARPADAERHFRLAVSLNPGPDQLPEDPRVDYGAFLFREGRLEEALPLLQQAVQSAPNSSRAHAELGRVLLHLDKTDSAVASLESAVKIAPKAWEAHLLLGRAYLQANRPEEGKRELDLGRRGLAQDQRSSIVR